MTSTQGCTWGFGLCHPKWVGILNLLGSLLWPKRKCHFINEQLSSLRLTIALNWELLRKITTSSNMWPWIQIITFVKLSIFGVVTFLNNSQISDWPLCFHVLWSEIKIFSQKNVIAPTFFMNLNWQKFVSTYLEMNKSVYSKLF